MSDNTIKKQLSELIISTSQGGCLKKAVFSKSRDNNIMRAVAQVRKIGKNVILQIEFFQTDNKVIHKNIDIFTSYANDYFENFCGNFFQVNIITSVGECEYRCSASGKEIIIGYNKIINKLSSFEGKLQYSELTGNDNVKRHILKGNEDFLIELGISDKNGRPHDKCLSKLRQINRFLEYIKDIEKHLPNEGVINICDLCCGKSYLSFAVYYYFSEIKKREVEMMCVDLKSDVMDYCSAVAKSLSFCGMHFICENVATYEPPHRPELVVSLHACDTATDLVLNKASNWHTKVILSTPCCHHEMNHMLNCEALSFISEHSMLKQKFCDAATDALRLKKLQSEGYHVEAVELVDPEDTPKNILLRAVLLHKPNKKAFEEYSKAKIFLLGASNKLQI